MSDADQNAEGITIYRHSNPETSPERWEISNRSGKWCAVCPKGVLEQSFSDPVKALIQSGACEYRRGAALDIRTPEGFDPFRLLPALASWADVHGAPHDGASDWSPQPRLRWVERILEDEGRFLRLDYGRLIRINDLICGAYIPQDEAESEPTRHLILFQPADPLWPVFYDAWASTSTDNGWGMADYEIGEITPGFEGEMRHVHGHEAELRISRLAADHPKGLYDAMVSWVADIDSITHGLDEELCETDDVHYGELEEDGGDVNMGSFGPTVLRSKELA